MSREFTDCCTTCRALFPISALKAHKGHPYCADCFPKGVT
jgi:hypothetical protein